MTPADLAAALWLAIVVVVVHAGLPRLVQTLCPRPRPPLVSLMAGLLCTAALGTVGLSIAGFVNAITVVVIHGGWAAAIFFRAHRTFDSAAERILRLIVRLDDAARPHCRPSRWRGLPGVPRPPLLALALLAVTVVASHVAPAIAEVRLFHPAAYDHLSSIRGMLGGQRGDVVSPVLGWMASISTLAALDPARVVHLLPPLLVTAVVAALLWSVRRYPAGMEAAFVAALVWLVAASGLAAASPWGDVLALQHAAPGPHLGSLALLVLLATRARAPQRALAVVLVLCAPVMAPIAAVALVAPRRHRVGAAAVAWLAVAGVGLVDGTPAAMRAIAVTLPAALGLAAAAAYAACRLPARAPEPAAAQAFGLAMLVAGVGLAAPRMVIEHDVVARASLQVLELAAGEPWTLAGTGAPLLQRHHAGRLVSVTAFRACVEAPTAGCTDAGRRHMFVFIQKRPFALSDAPAELVALGVAERWAHATPGVRIVHDDTTLRVYHLPRTVGP